LSPRTASIGALTAESLLVDTTVVPAKAGIQLVDTTVVPAKAGIHFDLDGRNMDSRFRGNDDKKCPASFRGNDDKK
jgi:hypothetical protein